MSNLQYVGVFFSIPPAARWHKKLGRPLMGTEMLGAMGVPVTKELADGCGVPLPDLSMLKPNAKVP